eukprot:703626_1
MALLVFTTLVLIGLKQKTFVISQECGGADEAAAINDVESCSFHMPSAVFGGLNLKQQPKTEETMTFNDAATQPIVIQCAMAATGNKKMDLAIKKKETKHLEDSATVFVGATKELCQPGPMTQRTVNTAEPLITIVSDEHGVAKPNIDIRSSTNAPDDPCICLIFWCNNEIHPCNMDIA